MPAKYSHVKKRSASGLLKPGASTTSNLIKETYHPHHSASHNNSHNGKFPFPLPPNLASLALDPHIDRSITQALTTISQLERTIARILLLRFEHDLARLFSTHLHRVTQVYVPTLVLRCVEQGGYGWLAWNGDGEEIKDFFRSLIGMDMREAGERVATKSVLWSYTALREFALSNNVPICPTRGLHSLRLLPYFPALKAHLDTLEAMSAPTFSKPPFLGKGFDIADLKFLEDECEKRWGKGMLPGSAVTSTEEVSSGSGFGSAVVNGSSSSSTSLAPSSSSSSSKIPLVVQQQLEDWRFQLRYSYTKLTQTLWRVAREEFDVRGYGIILREKLTVKWCECGCSTDHLGEVCERSVREEEEGKAGIPVGGGHDSANRNAKSKGDGPGHGRGGHCADCGGLDEKDNYKAQRERVKVRIGKQKEWDGRGSGVYGWETTEEGDIWEVDMDFGGGGGKNKKSAQNHNNKPKSKASGKVNNPENTIIEEEEEESNKANNQPGKEEEAGMTIGKAMEWRFIKAERKKEQGNIAFRKGLYEDAVKHYEHAYEIEPEMPHYQLNLAAAHLKLNHWIEAETACTMALGQHRSSKGYFRRAKARKMLGKTEEAIQDLRSIIRLQPTNAEAMSELLSLLPTRHPDEPSNSNSNSNPSMKPNPDNLNLFSKGNHASESHTGALYDCLGVPRPKRQKPPPFVKTRADERKLKILPLPLGSTEAGFVELFITRESNGKSIPASGHGKGKTAKEGVRRGALRGTAAEYGIVFLEWDRYVVKRLD